MGFTDYQHHGLTCSVTFPDNQVPPKSNLSYSVEGKQFLKVRPYKVLNHGNDKLGIFGDYIHVFRGLDHNGVIFVASLIVSDDDIAVLALANGKL